MKKWIICINGRFKECFGAYAESPESINLDDICEELYSKYRNLYSVDYDDFSEEDLEDIIYNGFMEDLSFTFSEVPEQEPFKVVVIYDER